MRTRGDELRIHTVSVNHSAQIDSPLSATDSLVQADVSFAEEQLWLAERGGGTAVPFLNCRTTMSMVARLENALDREALVVSLNEIVTRHEVLRSVFRATDGRLQRCYEPSATVRLTEIDLRDTPDADRSAPLEHLLAQQSQVPFDLAKPPLIRAMLVKVRDTEHVLALTVPHIVFDRASKGVLAQDLSALYSAHLTGSPVRLEPLPAQYRDYVRWQRERLAGNLGHVLLDYWSGRLRVPSGVQVPCDGDRSQPSSTRSGIVSFTISASDVGRLKALSRRSRLTMSTLMLAIVRVFIHGVGGEGDAAIGLPLTDRRRPEFVPLIGLFMNVAVVRTTTTDRMTFAEVLDRVRRALVEASRHQDMPYGYLLRVLPGANPLYRILFNFMPALPESVAQLAGLRVTPLWIDSVEPSVADLSVQMVNVSGALACRLVYKADLFTEARVRRYATDLQALIGAVLDTPHRPIGAFRPA
jgi:hypothetical protein